jgi:excisionase family DNA binding protein
MDNDTHGPATPGPRDQAPALWTVTEVASALRVSKMTIYRMVHSGELAHVRIGGSYRIPDDAVRALLGTSPPPRGDH